MSILWMLLKIIGILFLIVLGVILFVLIHPIFYQVKGEAEEEITLKGHFWWIFQIIRLEFELADGEFKITRRIFGFTKKESDDVQEERTHSDEETHERLTQTIEKAEGDQPEAEESESEVSEKEQVMPKKKVRRKKRQKNNNMQKFSGLKQEILDEKNQMAVGHLWKEILYLFKHLKPKYAKGEISFSAGEPSRTGQFTGVLSLLPVIYRYQVHVYPDFMADECYVRGNLKIKGHMPLYRLLIIMVRLFADTNIRRLMSKFK